MDDGLCNKNNQFYYHWSSSTTTAFGKVQWSANAILAPHVAKRTSLVIFLKPIINSVFFIQKTLFTSKAHINGYCIRKRSFFFSFLHFLDNQMDINKKSGGFIYFSTLEDQTGSELVLSLILIIITAIIGCWKINRN